jgi:hypothetical protein
MNEVEIVCEILVGSLVLAGLGVLVCVVIFDRD